MLCWPFYKERPHRCTQEVLSLEAKEHWMWCSCSRGRRWAPPAARRSAGRRRKREGSNGSMQQPLASVPEHIVSQTNGSVFSFTGLRSL